MCRFLLYHGQSDVRLCDLLTKPVHSIIKQSFDSKLRVDFSRPLNGDGFGVGWYEANDTTPCIFTSVMPAWNNPNLIRLADKIKSHLVFAHVRAASLDAPISEANCHPWCHGKFMWMHNGYITQFTKIKRWIQQSLPDECFNLITGTTDSENVFALYLSLLPPSSDQNYPIDVLVETMRKTISKLNQWSREAGITEPSLMNFALTDGEKVVVCRYNNVHPAESASLFYSSGTKFECYEPGLYRMVNENRREHLVIIASEPLTHERVDWLVVPENSIISITPKSNVLIFPIKELLTDPPTKVLDN